MENQDGNTGKSSEPEDSVDAGSHPADEAGTGSNADSPAASAESTPSMGDVLKTEMDRINDASQERLERQTQETGAEESPASEETGDKPDSKTEDGTEDRTGESEQSDEEKQAEADKAEKEWLEKQKPETSKRFQELTGKLKSSTEEVTRLREQVGQQKEAVERMTRFNRWVNETAGFKTTQQWNEFLQMGALINNDPTAALEKLESYTDQLRENLGLAGELPADIQKRLDDGLIDEASARELAKTRRLREIDTITQRERSQREQARDIQGRREAHVRGISDAVNEAEQAWRAKDPDYDALASDVQDKVIALLQREGRDLKSKEDAVDLFNRAVKAVKDLAKRGQQTRQIRQPAGSSTGTKAATGEAPKTLLGAMKRAYREGKEAG